MPAEKSSGAHKVKQTHRGVGGGPNYTQPVSQFKREQEYKKSQAAASKAKAAKSASKAKRGPNGTIL